MQYDALAPIYDRLMFHVEYAEWVGLIRRAALRYCGTRKPEILEIGAGTGIVGALLKGLGYQYTASDLSFSMCKQARDKRGLTVCAADARHLPFKKQFDMAVFLYDGINYLHTQNDYRRLFASVHGILAPSGLFLFDITTRANSLKYFTNYYEFEDYGDASFVRHSYFDEKKSVQHNDFTIHRRAEGLLGDDGAPVYEKHIETHRQKVFSVPDIEGMIPKKRFEVLGIWDGYSFKKYSNKSERIHFLLKKC